MALPKTRSARRLFAGVLLAAATVAAVLGQRGFSSPYEPQAPAYRQKGPADAPVRITEFSDFECPACAAAVDPLKRIETLYPGKIHLVFKHHPWPFHPWARDAAIAAECAGMQGKFWEFGDILFASQTDWAQSKDPSAFFERYVKQVNLDEKTWAECRKGNAAATLVDADMKEARRLWVNSTPTFFVNGTRLVGARQLRTYGLNRIEDILKHEHASQAR